MTTRTKGETTTNDLQNTTQKPKIKRACESHRQPGANYVASEL